MSHLANAFQILAIAQEPNSQPGQGLTASQTVLYFVIAPVALFVVIGALAWAGGSSKRDGQSSITHIED
jgi:hypothetical protein